MRNLFLAAAFALAPAAASAQPPAAETMTCPVGGGSFSFTPTGSVTATGERPDGKPFGSTTFPVAVPECPDNGLVLYKDYTAEEVAKLEPMVASEAYQALRREDTPYYRAYWLMKAMGLPPERYLWALLQASWEAETKPELRKRYLTELVEASAAVPARPGDLNWIGMEGRAINALRELGRFDEALARLDKVPLAGLNVPVPAAAGGDAAAQTKIRRAWFAFFTALRPAIERRDSSVEPLDLLPRSVAVERCVESAGTLDEAGRALCDRESAAVARIKAERDKLAREMEALRQSREASGR